MLQKYKTDKIQEQIAKDSKNALSSLKAVPNKCTIKPHMKVPLKIQFKPIGMISNLDVQVKLAFEAFFLSLHYYKLTIQLQASGS